MYPTTLLNTFLLVAPLLTPTHAQKADKSITDPTVRALYGLSTLQIWYNAGTGLWDTAGWWNSANAMTMIANMAKQEPENKQMQEFAVKIFQNTVQRAPRKNPQPGVEAKKSKRADLELGDLRLESDVKMGGSGYSKARLDSSEPFTTFPAGWDDESGQYLDVSTLVTTTSVEVDKSDKAVIAAAVPNPADWLDGFYDDDLWWALAWIGAYDVTGNIEYLQLAEGIFMGVTKAWPSKCNNGGIWWSWKKDYVNAIANELFLSTAAHLANRAENASFFLEWAERSLDWFMGTGMLNDDNLINDGLDDNCENNGLTTWTYNQGVILGGLVELNAASPNKFYIELATRIARAALYELSDDEGVLHDGCEPGCGGDASQFKGIFMRNLAALQQAAPRDEFRDAIRANADSIWVNNRDRDGDAMSINWAGPYVRNANATTHSSAMDALVAAIGLE